MADNYIDVTLSEIFGTGVASVEQTQTSEEPGGLNVWTITLTNGYTSTFTVRNGTAGGTPMPVVNSADMTDTNGIYLYLGNEEGYTTGHWYCYANGMWTDFGAYSEKGEPGFAPTVETSKTGGTTTVTITDAVGEHVITIEDGISPTVNVANTASDMTDTSLLYVYAGSETGYTNGNWYFYNTTTNQWTSGGQYQSTVPRIDTSLTVSGAAADSAKVGQEISDLKREIAQGSGLTESVKQALLACFEKVAWSGTTGRALVDALGDALYPPAILSRITAVYTQGSTVVYDTDTLDSLKENLVVTAYYDNGTTEVVSSYVLSGTLTEGTSTITATYGGKSATFDVVVTEDTEYGTFTPTEVVTGSYINTDGSIGTYEASAYSETYYPVKHNIISFGGTGWTRLAAFNVRFNLYDAGKTFLRQLRIRGSKSESADYHGNPTVIAIPNDAKYFRLSWTNEELLPNPQFTITNLAYTDIPMEIGDIDNQTGEETVNAKRIRSDYIAVDSASIETQKWIPFLETQSEEYKNAGYFFRCYDSSKALIGSTSYTQADTTISLPTGTEFVRLLMQFNANDIPTDFDERIYRPFVMNSVNYFITKASE